MGATRVFFVPYGWIYSQYVLFSGVNKSKYVRHGLVVPHGWICSQYVTSSGVNKSFPAGCSPCKTTRAFVFSHECLNICVQGNHHATDI